MADLSSVSRPNPTSSSQPHPVRIHFSDRFLAARTHDDSSRSSSISFASPAQPMLQSRSDSRIAEDMSESRRRVRSLEHDTVLSGTKLTRSISSRHHGSRRKRNPVQSQSPALSPLNADSLVADFEPSAFSDEYDLSHEDPKILQDVQRALYLQSRRRERTSQQVHSMPDEARPTDTPINTTTPYASMSTRPPSPHSSPQYLQTDNLPAEVDFSPSTRTVPLHPVPLSSNGGATLDWAGFQSEEEKLGRRWSISRGKRKARERALPSSKTIVEKQETLFTDRISRMRAEASLPTVRKAAIVGEQLRRRYNILYASVASGEPVGLTQIARWRAGLGPETSAWLDGAEPLAWLNHLDRRRKRRSQWHVSALIVEEYIKFMKGTTSSMPPPQSPAVSHSLETSPSRYPLKLELKQTSLPRSDSSPGTSLSKVPLGRNLSFSPFVENSRDSLRSSQTRGEKRARKWRHSIPTSFDLGSVSGNPSPYHYRNSGGLSPMVTRPNFPDIVHRFHRQPVESEEGSSSPFGSQSEDQNDSSPIGARKKRNKRKSLSHLGESQSLQEPVKEINPPSNDILNVHSSALLSADYSAVSISPTHPDLEMVALPEENHSGITPSHSTSIYYRHPFRSTSLPLEPPVHPIPSKGELEEDGLEKEYEVKLRTLEELRNQNHRLRHRMQRVAIDVREYELVCSSVMPALGIAYHSLPMELLDALSHDPSAVTGGTRKRCGWRVVEDIHARVLRQREIVTGFLSVVRAATVAVSMPESILDQPISALMERLQALEREREPLHRQASEVSRMLNEVRTSHSTVKEEYNEALSYTSVVYPELSRIVALEESYKDQYQQVWELGLDALTVILDTIAPFWRSYGKIIGEDMQDFVIIPWYRNEFTGESKRYAVQSVPRRSFRHWIGLVCLAALTFFVTFLQARAAIRFASHYRLLWIDNQAFRWAAIPFFWVVILIQWLALLFEACVVLLYIAVVAWWLGWFTGICT